MEGISENIDKQWVAALKKGDPHAFDELFHLYGKRLYHFSLGYLKSKPEAEEVVQEVFLKIWNNRESLKTECSFQAYLFTIAYRHIRDLFLKISREQAYRHQIVEASLHFNDELDERTNFQSLLELVDQLIDELPPRQKEIVVLRKKEGIPVKEIAEKLGISPKTVENHLTEAMKSLRRGLGNESGAGLLFFLLFLKN